MKILLVDDNVVIRTYTSYLLLKEGYDVHTAENPLLALKTLSELKPDLIISDLMMPEMNGYEFMKEIRASYEFRHIPLIMISTLNDPEQVSAYMKEGLSAYLNKPFQGAALINQIKQLI